MMIDMCVCVLDYVYQKISRRDTSFCQERDGLKWAPLLWP